MRPSRTREERAQNNLYLNEQDLVKEHQRQAEEKRKMKQLQELQDKEETLNHYKNNMVGNGNIDPETADMLKKLKQEEDFVNRLKAQLENQDPDLFIKLKEEQTQKQRREKVEQYQKIQSENNDPNEFMFVRDPTSGQQLSKGEIERQKRLQLREQERQRRLLGQESSAYDQQKRDQPLSLPFQLEQQINGATEEERKQKKLNDLFDEPSQPNFNNYVNNNNNNNIYGSKNNTNNDDNEDMFRQTQSNFHHNQNFNGFSKQNYDEYDNRNTEVYPQQNSQNVRNNQEQYEETDIFGNKKSKKVIQSEQPNRPTDNSYLGGDYEGNQNYQSPQQNNIYTQNTQKLQQNFSHHRKRSFHENQQDDGKLPSIQSNNRKSNDVSLKQNQQNYGGNNIFGPAGNQMDSKKEKMLKYRQELDQQKEIKNQIGFSIKPYSAQQEKRSHNYQGSPSSKLPPPIPNSNNSNNNNNNRDGFFDKFGQDPQFKKNLQNWEQQQFRNLQNAPVQFKPYSAQVSREPKNPYNRQQSSNNVNNNNDNNFFDKFGQDHPNTKNHLRRPQSYQNLDEQQQNMNKMSKQEYADFIMKDISGSSNAQNNRGASNQYDNNNNNNNSFRQQGNLNRSLNNLDDQRILDNNNNNNYNRFDNFNEVSPYSNQQNQQQQQQVQNNKLAAGGGGLFLTDEEEQKNRQREKQRELQKELEEQIRLKKQQKEDEKRKQIEYDQRYGMGLDKQGNEAPQRGANQQQQQQQQQQLNYQPSGKSLDYDQQGFDYNSGNQKEQNKYDQVYQQQPQQQQQQQGGNYARNKVLLNENMDKEGQLKAMEAKKRYAEELNQQKQEAELKKQQEKKRQQEEDLLEEMKMQKQREEDKRKHQEEEQKKNRQKQEVDDFNKNRKVDQDDKSKGERVKAGYQDPIQNENIVSSQNNRKPNYHNTKNAVNNNLDGLENRFGEQNKLNESTKRLDIFDKNLSIQQYNNNDFDYNNQNNNLSNNNQNNFNNFGQNDFKSQQFQQNQFSQLQNNQFQQNYQQNNQFQPNGGMPNNNMQFSQNMNMMNQMMPFPNQFDYNNMYNPYQIMMQQQQFQNMMQMMQMDHQYFNQMPMAPPNLQFYLYNRNEFEIQKQIMEEKLRINQFALQEQNLIDEYRQRLVKAKEDKDEFDRKINRMKQELESKFGEHFNMQLFSQVILDDSQRNRQVSVDFLQQSVANFRKNTESLDQQIQKKQTNSNFFLSSSQKPPLPFDTASHQLPSSQLNQRKNLNTVGINDSNNSLYNQIKKLEEPSNYLMPPAQPQRMSQMIVNQSNFEGTLRCDTKLEEIVGFDFDQSFVRDKLEFEQQNKTKNQLNDSQQKEHIIADNTQPKQRNNIQFEDSNMLRVPDQFQNNMNDDKIQQSFMQKTYQSVNASIANTNLNNNTNANNAQQSQFSYQKSNFNHNSQNFNEKESVIEEMQNEEMDDSQKNNDKSVSNNNTQISSNKNPIRNDENKFKFKKLERQNLMKNASDFNNHDEVEEQEHQMHYQLKSDQKSQDDEDQDQFYSSGYAQSESKRIATSQINYNESQQPYQSQLINLELKKTADYYKVFQEHFAQEDGKESRFSKYNHSNNDDQDENEDDDGFEKQKRKKSDKEDFDEIGEDEDGFEPDGYQVNKYYNKEQIVEEDIEGTGTGKNIHFEDKFHFDSEHKNKLKLAMAEINRNSNELGQLENTNKQSKDNTINSIQTNTGNISKGNTLNSSKGNIINSKKDVQMNQNTKQNQRDISYQQIQQHLDESVNVPKKERKEDDGLGQTQISEIHSTLKETDMDKKIPANVMKLLRHHTDILHNSQTLNESSSNKNAIQNKNNDSNLNEKRETRTPAVPKNSHLLIQQNLEAKKSAQEINWEMQQQQMIDQKSYKFQSQHWNQDLTSKKALQNQQQQQYDDEIPEVIEFNHQQEIEMKDPEYNIPEHSLVLPEDEIDKEKIGQFIESSSGQKNLTKLSDPEDQQTMQSEDFDNNEDLQRHMQLNMLKNLNNQMKEQHIQNVKNMKLRPYSANMPLVLNSASRQNVNPNSNNNTNANFNINVNNSNITAYSTNHNNYNSNNNNNTYNSNYNSIQDKKSSCGFKKPKTIDIFGKITSPKNHIPPLEQSSSKNKITNTYLEEQNQPSQPAIFQYKSNSTSYEQSQFINNLNNNNNNPPHKLVSMTRMDDQTGIYNNLINPSSILHEEQSYQLGGQNSSQPSFIRHDIQSDYNSDNLNNNNQNKPASSTQSLPKKSEMILNRLNNIISTLENSSENSIQIEEKKEYKQNVFRSSFNKN